MAILTWTALLLLSLPCLASRMHEFHACTNPSSVNLLKNPSFEDGTEGWTIESGKVIKGFAADGSHYLALPRLKEKVLWQAKQQVTNLDIKKDHTVSVSFRTALDPGSDITSASCLIGIVIRNSNSSAFVATREHDTTKSPTNWESLSGTFVPPFSSATLELTATCLRLRPGTWRERRVVDIHLDDARLSVSPDKACDGFTGYKAPNPKARRATVASGAPAATQPEAGSSAVPETKHANTEAEAVEPAAGSSRNPEPSALRPQSDNPTKVFSDPHSHSLSLSPAQHPEPTPTRCLVSKTVQCHRRFGSRRKCGGSCGCGCRCCPCKCECPKKQE